MTNNYSISYGWYKIDFDTLEHTFVKVTDPSNNVVWFNCYDDVSTPAQYSSAVSITDEALSQARLVACGSMDDIRSYYDNYPTSPNYDSNKGYYKPWGDCSGIIYGVTGVCHQMANRILYPNSIISADNVPSYRISSFLYGPYGSTSTQYPWTSWSFPQPFLNNITQSGIDVENWNQLATIHQDILNKHENLITSLYKGKIDPENYAKEVNDNLSKTLNSMAGVLNEVNFQKLFGCHPDQIPKIKIVDPQLMKNTFSFFQNSKK